MAVVASATIEEAATVGTNLTVSGITDTVGMRTGNNAVATANTTTTLVSTSDMVQLYTGSTAGQIVKLPDATTISSGHRFEFWNEATVTVTVQDNAAGALFTISPGFTYTVVLRTAGTAAGAWDWSTQLNQNTGANQFVEVSATSTTTTTSTTDVLISSMTTTPSSGTYYVNMSGVITFAANNQVVNVTIYTGGSTKADSLRSLRAPNGNASTACVGTSGIVTVNGAQAIEIKWSTSASTASMTQRTLDILKVG